MFQSGKGDCLLLTNQADTARILVDGGMPAAYRDHVAPAMGKLRAAKKKIDLVYVSHIDQDHIGGVLTMLDDQVAWKVHDHQKKNGNPKHKAPAAPRPPAVGAIWHNAFHEQLTKNAGDIEAALAAAAPILSGAEIGSLREAGLRQAGLVTSVREAIRVSRRIGKAQLGIPLNQPAKGKLLMLRAGQKPIKLGGMQLTILGPTATHLKKLRDDWKVWLRNNKEALQSIRDASRKDQGRLGTSEFDRLLLMVRLQAESFGDPKKVTPPNLASLTLLVEEGGQTLLLTGDAVGTQLLDGLQQAGRLTNGPFTVDVLKVPHHGSENNIDSAFCDAIVAKHYVFCGNGEHENPNHDVVKMIARRRLAAKGAGPFKFWFNSSEVVTERAAAVEHMTELQRIVGRLAKGSQGQMSFKFLEGGSSLKIL
jgi:beta-lactamase superfamily II metal-dependent hydrolase